MIVDISSDAEEDLIEGYWFYERQSPGLGDDSNSRRARTGRVYRSRRSGCNQVDASQAAIW